MVPASLISSSIKFLKFKGKWAETMYKKRQKHLGNWRLEPLGERQFSYSSVHAAHFEVSELGKVVGKTGHGVCLKGINDLLERVWQANQRECRLTRKDGLTREELC